MKNITALVLLCISTISLAQDMTTVKLSGKITNPTSDTVIIKDGWGEQFHLMTLDKNGSFSSAFEIETGYYYLNDLNESTSIYLGENYDLYITLDTDSFDESLTFKGTGAGANNYLAKKALMKESWGLLDYYGYYCKLEEKAFLKLADSLYNKNSELLTQVNIEDANFILLETAGIKHGRIRKWDMYEGTYRYLTSDKDFTTSQYFPKPYLNFEIDNPKLIKAPQYISTTIDYLYQFKDTALFRKNGDYSLYMLEAIRDSITNDEMRKRTMFYFCRTRLTGSKKMDECFDIYNSIETDPQRLKLIEDKYLARKKTQKGATSPPFSYENNDGKIVTNEELKGKFVYIDLWATWCGPCLRQIPYFDTLQEAFKNRDITFVSICQNDTKERWKATIAQKELKGLQLFAEGEGGQFYEDYQVTGIPRYILLDPQGKIVDSDAKRPSDKRLVAELEALLK